MELLKRRPKGLQPDKSGNRPSKQTRHAALWRTALLIGFLLAWELLAAIGLVDPRSASRPSNIIGALAEMASGESSEVYQAILDTLYALMMSFLLGIGMGGAIDLALGLNRLLRDAYLPIVIFLLGIPKTIFLPLFVLFFGLGPASSIAFGTVLAFLVIAVNVVAGIDSIPQRYFSVGRAYGAGRTSRFNHIILPGAAPALFAGLWHGIRNAFIGVLIAQMFVSNVGIGYLVKAYTNTFRIDAAMALILLSAVMIILIGSIWELAEARLTRWRLAAVRG